MKSGSPLLRQWMLLRMLAGRRYGMSVEEIARELEVSIKTARRDLETFVTAGFPLKEESGRHGRKTWAISDSGDPPSINFAFDEALALYLGRSLLEPLAGTLLWEAAQSAFNKVRSCLGETATQYLDRMSAALHHTAIGAGDYSQKAEMLDSLMQAIEECKATQITYQSARATESVTYEIYPLGIAYHRGSLYLVADSRDHGEIRHFKIDRVEDVFVSTFNFNPPVDFDLQRHFKGSFGIYDGKGDILVKVRFAPSVARYVAESKWHHSQKLVSQRDGGLIAEFQLSSTTEIKAWLLSFGAHVVVLEPEELRTEIEMEIEEILRNYNKIALRRH